MAEACKRLIKNCIICWNYLYLSQKLEEITDAESREALLDAVAHGSTVAWRHLNLLGEYDFSAEKLRDSVGIRLPKIGGLKKEAFLDLIQLANLNVQKGLGELAVSHLVPLLEFNLFGENTKDGGFPHLLIQLNKAVDVQGEARASAGKSYSPGFLI